MCGSGTSVSVCAQTNNKTWGGGGIFRQDSVLEGVLVYHPAEGQHVDTFSPFPRGVVTVLARKERKRSREGEAARDGGASGRRERAARAGGAIGWREVMVCRWADGAVLGRNWGDFGPRPLGVAG